MDVQLWIIGFLGSATLSMLSFLLGRISMNRKIEMLAERMGEMDNRLVRIETLLNGQIKKQ